MARSPPRLSRSDTFTAAHHPDRLIWGREHPETFLDDDVRQSLSGILDTRGLMYVRLGRAKEADADMEKCGQLRNTLGICIRVNWYKRLGRFDGAAADRARAVKARPSDFGSWEELAALQLYLGHEKEYLAARRELLDHLKQQKHTSDHPLKTCLLFPLNADELKVCMAIADRNNVPTYHEIQFYHSDKGLAAYRAKDYEEAISWLSLGRKELNDSLTTNLEAARDPNNTWDKVRTADDFVLAMCKYQLGRRDDAREALAVALEHLRTSIPSASSGQASVGSLDWLMVQIIAREAQTTILGNDSATMPTTVPSTTRPASQAAVPASDPTPDQ